MANIDKPTNLSKVWASGGDVLTPSDAKIGTGWEIEIPPRQWFNWLDNRQDQAIAHINQHGVAVWDSDTEYQASKSYAQGPTNGIIYRCVQLNTNQNPETDVSNTYWQIAFAAAGDFYTKAEAEATFLEVASNLSDLTNTATARTNLSVYSQAQTYTKTEVDSKTTVASAAQAQALTSNTVLMTPLRLAEAFQGANQALSPTNGSQKYPGGLIIKAGVVAAVASGNGTTNEVAVAFPEPFPTACIAVIPSVDLAGGGLTGGGVVPYYRIKTAAGFNIGLDSASDNTTAPMSWVAIGY